MCEFPIGFTLHGGFRSRWYIVVFYVIQDSSWISVSQSVVYYGTDQLASLFCTLSLLIIYIISQRIHFSLLTVVHCSVHTSFLLLCLLSYFFTSSSIIHSSFILFKPDGFLPSLRINLSRLPYLRTLDQ